MLHTLTNATSLRVTHCMHVRLHAWLAPYGQRPQRSQGNCLITLHLPPQGKREAGPTLLHQQWKLLLKETRKKKQKDWFPTSAAHPSPRPRFWTLGCAWFFDFWLHHSGAPPLCACTELAAAALHIKLMRLMVLLPSSMAAAATTGTRAQGPAGPSIWCMTC